MLPRRVRTVLLATGPFGAGVLASMVRAGAAPSLLFAPHPRPAGRGRKVAEIPSVRAAGALGVPSRMLARKELGSALREAGIEVAVVADCGWILPSTVLSIPPHGFVGVHPSLLPAFRGAAPAARSILAGCSRTGVSVFRVVAEVDAGPIAAVREAGILPGEDRPALEARLALEGGALLAGVLADLGAGRVVWREQDPAGVSFAPKMSPAEGRVDWCADAVRVERLVRALAGWPWAHTTYPGPRGPMRLNLIRVEPVSAPAPGSPGTVLATGEWPVVLCGTGAVRIVHCTPSGKRPMGGDAFLRGHPRLAGVRIG